MTHKANTQPAVPNVPALRFPEFQNDGDWEKKQLGECIKNIGGTALEEYVNTSSHYKFISIGNYSTDGKYIDNGQRVELNNKAKTKILSQGDLVMVLNDKTVSGDIIGSTILVDKDDSYIYNQRSERIICKPDLVPIFTWHYLNSKYFRSKVYSVSQGGTQIYVNFLAIKKLEFPLPSLVEQQKIADCLSSLDDLITAQNQKIDALKAHKKGLMQQLFPVDGNPIPALRFPEFQNAPEWDALFLDKVINDFIVPMRDKPKSLNGQIPWCRIEDFDGMYLSASKSNQGVTLDTVKKMNLKIYPVGTLLVSCSADLGRCAITKKELVTNQTFIGLVPNPQKGNAVFLYFAIKHSRNLLNDKSSGTTISYLSRKNFEKFKINVPDIKEQKKIADCLSSLDDLITAQSQKIDTLKQHKKGLMQNLFPN